MKYGVFGGTFDPPHVGHLALARAAIEQLELDEVLWVPTHQSPFKTRADATSARRRLKMVDLCLGDEPHMAVSDIEIVRGGVSYTVDTLDELTMVRPGEYWLLLGADSLASLYRWRRYEHLLRLCRIGAAARAPQDPSAILGLLPPEVAERTDIIAMEPQDVSSSMIRQRVFHEQSVAKYLKPAVLNYIEENRLYIHE